MAVVPLSDTEMLVIESRRKIGYDAEEEVTFSDGAVAMLPTLAVEGVLVYTVDASVFSGQLPMKLPGDDGDNRIDDYPIITGGKKIFVAGYTDRGGPRRRRHPRRPDHQGPPLKHRDQPALTRNGRATRGRRTPSIRWCRRGVARRRGTGGCRWR